MSTRAKRAAETDPLSVLGDALESAAETFGEATANARASAKVAARKAERLFSAGVYKGAYGISYALVFGAVFIKELLPEDNVLRRGFEEGAEAALDAAASKKVRSRGAGDARRKSATSARRTKPSQRRSIAKANQSAA
jgi:hypothetical protein